MSTRSPRLAWLVVVAAAPFIFGCRDGQRNSPSGAAAEGAAGVSAADDAPRRKVVLFVGTSLTAAHGLDPEQGFPALIQEKIDSAGLPFEVVNAGVSGETSRGARERMRWLLGQPFDVLVLETGANDMLRGTSLRSLRQNLAAIVDTVRAARPGARVVLAGMLAAPNLGERYAQEFRAVYADVARDDTLPLVPFLLEGVAADPALNLGDGIHPNARGHRVLAANVWRVLEPVLRQEAQEP